MRTRACTLLAAQDDARPPIPLSQFSSVTQRVGYTDIEVRYRRPVARGRELFGGIIDWGRIWTPGADSATTLAFSTDVRVNGRALAACLLSPRSRSLVPSLPLWLSVSAPVLVLSPCSPGRFKDWELRDSGSPPSDPSSMPQTAAASSIRAKGKPRLNTKTCVLCACAVSLVSP